jgi:8-oxo-dGTP pyrophosphatase MutT (NUDIX family)
VEEFRYPIGRRTWSFPQGGFGRGQAGTAEELARLELAQETGLRARELVKLGFLHCAHGMSSQGGHYFLATGLEPGPPDREHEEQDMRQAWVPRARFEEMIADGAITDDSTVAAYALLLMREQSRGPRPAGRL